MYFTGDAVIVVIVLEYVWPEAKKQGVVKCWLVRDASVPIWCCGFLEGDTLRLCSHPMWLGQASWANLLYALSVTLSRGLAAGGMLAQGTCCEERHL